MPEVPGNPFDPKAPKPNAIRDDAGLAGFMLGKEAEADMRAAEYRPTSHVPHPASDDPSSKFHVLSSLEEGMSAEEREAVRFEQDPAYTRARILKWAKEFNIGNERWVDGTFKFEPDGSAVCVNILILKNKGITYFPKGIKEVRESLLLNQNQINKLENMPVAIGRDLILSENPIKDLKNLPASIGRDLWLGGIQAKEIPSGIYIGGCIYVNEDQHELIRDAKGKGYNVQISY